MTGEEPMEKENPKGAFLTEVYKARVQFFSDHASRSWTRFNILLSVELGLSSLFLAIWYTTSNAPPPTLWLLPVLGICTSTLWYVLGVQDRYAYQGAREPINAIEAMAAQEYGVKNLPPFNPRDIQKSFAWKDVVTWRCKPISLSRLLGISPLVFFVLWAIFLVISITR